MVVIDLKRYLGVGLIEESGQVFSAEIDSDDEVTAVRPIMSIDHKELIK